MYASPLSVRNTTRRRAIVAVQVAVMLVMLLGVAALTVDVGVLYNTRADLQRTADAAALAGASSYTTDAMMAVRMGSSESANLSLVTSAVRDRVNQFSGLNSTFGLSTTLVEAGDVSTGWLNLSSASDTIHVNPVAADFNAVSVLLRREDATEAGANGAVKLFFAPVLGWLAGEIDASAVAVFDDRVASVAVTENGADLMPFTIHEDAFLSELAAGGDQYAYDDSSGTVGESGDGIREVRIYPFPLSGNDYEEGDGNFGVLNIGTGNQGISAEEEQILNGVPASDFELEIGTSDLTFADSTGTPVTYDITGSPGMESSLKSTLSERVGDVVAFFLHDNVVLSGSNATYTITQIRYGRVMGVRLTGPPSDRGLYIQPVSYTGSEVRISPTAPSSGGLVGRIVLAR